MKPITCCLLQSAHKCVTVSFVFAWTGGPHRDVRGWTNVLPPPRWGNATLYVIVMRHSPWKASRLFSHAAVSLSVRKKVERRFWVTRQSLSSHLTQGGSLLTALIIFVVQRNLFWRLYFVLNLFPHFLHRYFIPFNVHGAMQCQMCILYNQRDATYTNQRSTCFGRFFRPSSAYKTVCAALGIVDGFFQTIHTSGW
jgi:hypothetical protein